MLCERELIIKNKLGLHARAAALFVKLANRFSSEVTVKKNDLKANGKSILGVLTLAAACQSKVKVICRGPDASDAIEALSALIEDRFQEE